MDRRLLVLALGMFALGTDSFVVAGVLPEIARSFDVGIGAAGQMTTVYAVTFALLSPTVAALASHLPRKLLLLTGLGIFVIANLATAVAPTFAMALVTRAIAGLGAAMFSPTATGSAASIVSAERRGFALSVVATGLTVSTAFGAPVGTLIGGLGDWHWTMVFVAALAAVSGIGVLVFLTHIPMPPPISLGKRLAPLADARIGLTLATTFLFLSAAFTIYTYFAVVFDRAIAGNPTVLAGLLVVWGVAGTASNLLAGRLIDRIGSRRVLVTMLTFLMADFVLLPWTGASLWSAIPAVFLWGACGWGSSVPQQHRIVGIAPHIAPIVLGLNNTAVFLGMTAAGIIGAAGIDLFGGHRLAYVAAALVAAAVIVSECAARKIAGSGRTATGSPAGVPEQAKA
jgi:MFS transporter, DHA1 family, inner membrane transport protein